MDRGAKVAMTVALRDPGLVSALVPVDNAPVDAVLKGDFAKYVRGMKQIEEARVTKQTEANSILERYEEVCRSPRLCCRSTEVIRTRPSRYGNFSLQT